MNFFRNTKRWGKFEFRPRISTYEFLTAIGYVTSEDVVWHIHIDEIKVSHLMLYDPNYGGSDVCYSEKALVLRGADVRQLYKKALKEVSVKVGYWKEQAEYRGQLLAQQRRACGKCVHHKLKPMFPQVGGYGPIISAYMLMGVGYMCHRYPTAVEVQMLHECGEFQG